MLPLPTCCHLQAETVPMGLVGEDAAAFDVNKQSVQSWGTFFGLLTGVLGLLYLVNGATFEAIARLRVCQSVLGLRV